MRKQLIIEGMSCGHCVRAVENALGALEGVSATVDLERGIATVTMEQEISDDTLIHAITEEGYKVIGVKTVS